jgi:predicted RNA binding protein YcfA (HicA-like mRNA interferase family)
MPTFGPISRRNLIRALRNAGYDGPFSGKRHEFMRNPEGNRVVIPNPHKGDIGSALLIQILRQANISRDEWEAI